MNIKRIEQLVKILENSNVNEIEVRYFFGRKIRISKSSNNIRVQEMPFAATSGVKDIPVHHPPEETAFANTAAIKSPIVGTFYRAPSPDASPYIEVGDTVKPGQVVCIVEAMKLMNEIESDVAGKVIKILVKNEDPVEYNQELFLIEPI
ncbi:acetyl-CoA carboxylase biotin carboxyl carrier protein [candidate division WOR-3 bacterium]|nr:acetyl-CoA carboxylase biotin carboxyl carrier protein [candidate division WOR-3 bacterium]